MPALLAGCAGGGGRIPVRSEAGTKAAIQLERGIRAYEKGEIQPAETFLADSLKISSSIEDNPARITALVNLARLNRLNLKPESATVHIDEALKLAGGQPDLMPEAAYEKALIEFAQNHTGKALAWSLKSLSYDNGPPRGKRLNLLARIHLAAGDRNEAASVAIMAREENHRYEQADEESNSLRLLGSMERENGRFIEAEKLLLESLEIDKQIGESNKIALDLEELAALKGDQGNLNMMIEYLERTFSVHINGARTGKAASTQLKMSEIYRKAGNIARAEKALQSAEQLMRKEPSNHKSSPESASPSKRP